MTRLASIVLLLLTVVFQVSLQKQLKGYAAAVVRQADSCAGKCELGLQPGAPCQCNNSCGDFGDCCDDYEDNCFSCENRCGIGYFPNNFCQCNSECPAHGNCCADFGDFCDGVVGSTSAGGTTSGGGGGTVSDQQLKDLSESLIMMDVNNAGPMVTTDYQGSTTQCSTSDKAPGPMYTSFDDAIWSMNTVSLLRALYDNYVPAVTVVEDHTAAEQAEEAAFLDAVMDSPVMTEAYNFLYTNEVFTGTKDQFRAKVQELWFDPYDRDGTSATVLGSSGFEHVFMGETKDGEVSGFHNWIKFRYEEEELGSINYLGWLEKSDFSGSGEGITNVFNWGTLSKCIGGFFVGTSPELELAVYTTCFLTREGRSCNMQFNGAAFNVITYTLDQNGKEHIGTAYPDWL